MATNDDLQRFTVGVTADRRGEEQALMLRRLGVQVVHAPVLKTLPPSDPETLRSRTLEIISQPPDYLVANTGIGIRNWLSMAATWELEAKLHDALERTQILARGPKAAGALKLAGLDVAWRSPTEQLADVTRHLLALGVAGKRVAFQLHGDNSQDLSDQLVAAGAQVMEIPVYRWTMNDERDPILDLIERCCAAEIDVVTFTAAPAVRNLFEVADAEGRADALRAAFNSGVITACIGPVCAAAAREEGIEAPITPEHWRLGSLVRLVGETLTTRQPR